MRESDAPSLLLTDTEHEYLRDNEEFTVLLLAFVADAFTSSINVEVKDKVCQSDKSQDLLNDTAQTIETTSETTLKQTVTVSKRRKNSGKESKDEKKARKARELEESQHRKKVMELYKMGGHNNYLAEFFINRNEARSAQRWMKDHFKTFKPHQLTEEVKMAMLYEERGKFAHLVNVVERSLAP